MNLLHVSFNSEAKREKATPTMVVYQSYACTPLEIVAFLLSYTRAPKIKKKTFSRAYAGL